MLRNLFTSGCLIAALSVGAVGVADAQLRGDRAVYFTFNQPVVLPQVTLPAGKYLFRLADSLSNRTIVQIYEADGSKLHAMVMTLHTQRPEPSDDPEIRFLESPANEPPAIATWWYPGERTGWEFIYPREQATKLAQSSKQAVLTTSSDADTAEEMRSAELARVTPSGEQAPVSAAADAEARAIAGRAQPGEIAENAPALSDEGTPAAASSEAAASRPASAQSSAAQPPASAQPSSAARPSTAAQSSAAQRPAQSAQSSPARAPAGAQASAAQGADDDAPATGRTALPATASFMPAIWSSGMLALIGAFGMRYWRRSRVPAHDWRVPSGD